MREAPHPTAQRIVGLDVARAIAIIGMVVVNFRWAAAFLVQDGSPPPSSWLSTTAHLLMGRIAPLFVVLAGVGVSLLSQRARCVGSLGLLGTDRRRILARALFLFVTGILILPLWPGDILHFYGLYFAIGALMLGASKRSLLVLAVVFTGAFVALWFMMDYGSGWEVETQDYQGLWTIPGMLRHLLFNGFYPVFPWTAFLLLGMVLGRLDLRDGRMQRRLLAGSVAAIILGQTISFLLYNLGPAPGIEWRWLYMILGALMAEPAPPMPNFVLSSAGLATATIIVCVVLADRYPRALWIQALAATGQLALTLYLAQVFFGIGMLKALSRFEIEPVHGVIFGIVGFCVLALGFSTLWRRRFSRGPVEWAMRRLTVS